MDGPVERGVCWVQTRLSDRSALFSFVALRLQRSPGLLRFLYGLGSPDEGVEGAPRAPQAREAGVLLLPALPVPHAPPPLAVPASTPSEAPENLGDRTEAALALTSELILALAREVRASGAEFLLAMRRSDFEMLDAPRMRAEGIEPLQIYVPGGPEALREIRFENDSHFNARGHYYVAGSLDQPVAEALEARIAQGRP